MWAGWGGWEDKEGKIKTPFYFPFIIFHLMLYLVNHSLELVGQNKFLSAHATECYK